MRRRGAWVALSLLVLLAALPVSSDAQMNPPTMLGTRWIVLMVSVGESGHARFSWAPDFWTFSSGGFDPNLPGMGSGPYTESYGVVLPDLAYTIWESTIWLEFAGTMDFTGYRTSKNPNVMLGTMEHSVSGGVGYFLGFKIWNPQ